MSEPITDSVGAQSVGVRFEHNGKKYMGLAMVNFKTTGGVETIIDLSAIIIFEEGGLVSPSIGVHNGITEISFSGNTYKLAGRNLCIPSSDGTALKVLPFEPSAESINSVSVFRSEIERLVKQIELPVSPNPRTSCPLD